MKKAKLFLTALSALLAVGVSAQNITVTGNVTDASTGEGIPFASVIVKGTTQGVAADADGYYAIEMPADGALEFSSIGYMTQEIAVEGKTFVNAELEPDNEFIDETIVVAFGTTTKEAFTGSAKVLKSDELLKNQTTNVSEALVGKVAGVEADAEVLPGDRKQIGDLLEASPDLASLSGHRLQGDGDGEGKGVEAIGDAPCGLFEALPQTRAGMKHDATRPKAKRPIGLLLQKGDGKRPFGIVGVGEVEDVGGVAYPYQIRIEAIGFLNPHFR